MFTGWAQELTAPYTSPIFIQKFNQHVEDDTESWETGQVQEYTSSPVDYRTTFKYNELVPSSIRYTRDEYLKSISLCHPISVLEEIARRHSLPSSLKISYETSGTIDRDGVPVSITSARKYELSIIDDGTYPYSQWDFQQEADHVPGDITIGYSANGLSDIYGREMAILLELSGTSSMENGVPVYRYIDSIHLSGHLGSNGYETIEGSTYDFWIPFSRMKTVNELLDERGSGNSIATNAETWVFTLDGGAVIGKSVCIG